MSILKIVPFLLLFFFIFVVSSDGAELNCSAGVFSDQDFMTPRSQFVIDEKVYLRAVCLDLPPGKYEMAAVWYNPLQQVQRQDKHSFYLESVSGYSTFFWMKVLKKGALHGAVSNSSYSAKYYGSWRVKLYLDQDVIEPV